MYLGNGYSCNINVVPNGVNLSIKAVFCDRECTLIVLNVNIIDSGSFKLEAAYPLTRGEQPEYFERVEDFLGASRI